MVDVSAETCPMTFVRTRLQLDKMKSGEILEVRFKGEEPRLNLHRSIAEQGHTVLFMEFSDEGVGRLLIKKSP
ncbi:sulfurtransferase TusA family protein [Roseococcus sp.]|uniref:sulfurtransferase TusA family protein n=1 Tax=Roseococcus sp. TaxID=2109646 RepID=UPI003BAC2223